jgi:DMSO/TMAO reductase YedYZ molybdopterin-dependent catalytic subunit
VSGRDDRQNATPGNADVDVDIDRVMRVRSRRDFLALGGGAVAALAGWKWLKRRPSIGDVPFPLRRTLELNERLAEGYFDDDRQAPSFSRALAREPRVNGTEGLSDDFDPHDWRLSATSAGVRRAFTLAEIRALPRVEMTTDLKCIEGWSVVVNWAGARFRDFATAYQLGTRDRSAPDVRRRPRDLLKYVSLATPDGSYYVGLDVASAMHPQTLLCYEMNGAPLALPHGAPLRLVTTVKYGIKSIKRVGAIAFADVRPPDYWAERGYDWYAGL